MTKFIIGPNNEQENTNIMLTYSDEDSDEEKTLAIVLVPDLTSAVVKIKKNGGRIRKIRFCGFNEVVTMVLDETLEVEDAEV